jgi:hypothetical protein
MVLAMWAMISAQHHGQWHWLYQFLTRIPERTLPLGKILQHRTMIDCRSPRELAASIWLSDLRPRGLVVIRPNQCIGGTMWGLRKGQVCTLSCPLRNFGQPIRGDAISITSDSIIDLSHPTEELWFIELARDLLLFTSKPNVNSSFPRPAAVWHVFLDLFDVVLKNQRAVGCLF